ncbi:phage tail protein [Escherichia coli]|nr:phage tail protein [Escherichia coli]
MLGHRPNSILKAGQHRYQRAFIQRLNNAALACYANVCQKPGMRRAMTIKEGKSVIVFPFRWLKFRWRLPLKQAFDENVNRIRRERLPKELGYALKQQLRIAIKR